MEYNRDLIIEGNAVYEIDRTCQARKKAKEKAKEKSKVELENMAIKSNNDIFFYMMIFLLLMTKPERGYASSFPKGMLS